MTSKGQTAERVEFRRGFSAQIMGIGGRWRRDCTVVNVSETGATLALDEPAEGLDLAEFMLLLTQTGRAFRHCRMVSCSENLIGVEFPMRNARGSKKKYVSLPPDAA